MLCIYTWPTAHTGTIENNRFVSSETEGTFHFSTLEFSSKSQVDYPSPHGMHFTVGLLVGTTRILYFY